MYSRRQATTRPATEFLLWRLRAVFKVILVFCAMGLLASPCLAQIPVSTPQPPPPGQDPNAGKQGSIIKVDVGLVVLHTSVIDDRGKFADGLKVENYP